MIGPTCPDCQQIHCGTDTVAVGRFRPEGPLGYQAVGTLGIADPSMPLRATRAEAEADACRARVTREAS